VRKETSSLLLDARIQEFHEKRIAQTTLDKLVAVDCVCVVGVHLFEYGRSSLFGVIVTFTIRFAHQIVNGNDDLLHFFALNATIVVCVVQIECQLQFLSQVCAWWHRNGHEKLLKIDFARMICVEQFEQFGTELFCFALWKELFVDLSELLLV